MKKKISKYFTYKNVILLLIFLFFFIALRWNHFTAPFERDEGVYAYSAWIMRKGIMPYEYSFPYKPPMIIYTYLAGQVMFGDNVASPRILSAIFSLIAILIVGLIAKRESGKKAFWITIWLLSVMVIVPVNFGTGFLADIYYAANTEIFMLLPLVGFIYLYSVYKEKAGPLVWFFSGVLGTIAVGYKPICALILVYVYLFWIVRTWKADKSILNIIYKLGAAFLGVVLSSFVIFLPFLLSDGGKAVSNQLIGFTNCYKDMGNWDYSISRFINRIFVMGKYYWAVYLLVIYYLYRRPKNWGFYFGLLAVSYISVYQSLIGHYFILIMPFLALISAYSIILVSKNKLFKNIHISIITGFVILTILLPVSGMLGKTPQELGVWVYGNYDPHVEAQIVGEKIKEMTSTEDYIYVEGMDPEILYFANRKHAVRMEWTNFFSVSDCEFLDDYKANYMSDLGLNSPKVISLCVSGSCSSLWEDENAKEFMDYLSDMINRDYLPVGGWVPRDDGGYWLDYDGQEDVVYRTLIYQRKEADQQ